MENGDQDVCGEHVSMAYDPSTRVSDDLQGNGENDGLRGR